MKYDRVLLKLSGEALKGQNGPFDEAMLQNIADVLIKASLAGTQIGIVIGAGNIWRGKIGTGKMNPNTADHMGMLATMINCLALQDTINQRGRGKRENGGDVRACVQSAVPMTTFAESYNHLAADEHLKNGDIVIFGCGTGSPFFTTDTAAALRAIEIGADILLMAKNVDGVYSDDPRTNPNAVKYDKLTYAQVLADNLKAADNTAMALCMNNHMPMLLFALEQPENILAVLEGATVGTVLE